MFTTPSKKNAHTTQKVAEQEERKGRTLTAVPVLQNKRAQKMDLEEELPVQAKFVVQKQQLDEEEKLPMQGRFIASATKQQQPVQRFIPQNQKIQKKENNTGLPDNLKEGVENLSGIAMDDVKVHYNSDKPAQLQALAYAQGTDIHIGPGQEKHLPHEAWHVVQQKQGRVQPTMQMKEGVAVNDDKRLEHEADVMGGKANQIFQPQKENKYDEGLESPSFRGFGIIQYTIIDARHLIKDKKDIYNYQWSPLPKVEEVKKYIDDKKNGWEELNDAFEEGKRPTKKRKTVSDKEKKGTGKAAISWQKRKGELSKKIDSANVEIAKTKGELDVFFEKLINVPANIRVKIASLKEEAHVHLDREHSRLSNFSMSILEYSKEKLTSNKRTPEIQTAVIRHKLDNVLSLSISGNKSTANELLTDMFKNKNLEEGYKSTLRPFHIARKSSELREEAERKTIDDIKKLEVWGTPVKDYVKDDKTKQVKSKKRKREDNTDDKSINSIDEEVFKRALGESIVYNLHTNTKLKERNRRRKSARAFVKKERSGALGKAEVNIPANSDNIHAESAILKELGILKELKNDTEKIILSVGGTKVACTACQAFYTAEDLEELLGNNTSFAWLSESSITQLGFDVDKVSDYLLEIQKVLDDRLGELRFYPGGNAGTFHFEDLEAESDMDTDSEDEEGMYEALEYEEIEEKVTDIIKHMEVEG